MIINKFSFYFKRFILSTESGRINILYFYKEEVIGQRKGSQHLFSLYYCYNKK